MGLIENLRDRVIAFNNGLKSGEFIQNIILENEPFIVDMNAQDQLFEQGINRLGVSIMDYEPYKPGTVEAKIAEGKPYDRVTLRDEGDFESSFYIEADREKFKIKASDWKAEDLEKKYGQQIFGLTDENKGVLITEYIYPDLLAMAKNMVYGKN